MKKTISIIAGLIISTLAIITSAQAADTGLELAQRWDIIKYQTADQDARIAAYEKLITDAKAAAQADSDNPAPKVWAAITLATLGGEVGAMGGALSKVTEAKELLEAALKQHPNLELETSIHTTLGSLYYQVPGWPIGFGDEDKAVEHLEKALKLDPTSLGANFWMGSYLWEETSQREEAGRYFIKAIAAPARAGRAMADKGRKADAAELLAAVEKKLHHKVKLAKSE
ncbi:MAG: hypothetical protein Q9M16_07770 [Mariprofundus sp.]|nr:hypothetical protein [Mariprofundus sp.]